MKNGYQLAYPVTTVEHTGFSQTGDKIYSSHTEGGMTKREAIAVAAMQGILSNEFMIENGMNALMKGNVNSLESHVAGMALEFADELLKKLES